jgi:prepilin-type N-terminal cleavage/methylation domain-containing protein
VLNDISTQQSPETADEGGFTLVELLVVMLIMLIVGTIVTGTVIGAFGGTRNAQARVEALTDLQKGMERMTREIRAAHGVDIVNAPPVRAVEIAEPYRIGVNTLRDGGRIRFTYRLEGGSLRETRQVYATPTSTTVAATYNDTAQAPFIPDISNQDDGVPMFRYYNQRGEETADLTAITRIEVEMVRRLPNLPPITVSTQANLRNSRE